MNESHGYQIPNMLPAIYPVYNDAEIASILPGEIDRMLDITIEYRNPQEEKIYHVDFTKELTQRLEVQGGRYIDITLTPREAYAACGSTQHGWITVTDTNIPFKSGFSPDQWMPEITPSLSLAIRGRVGVNLDGGDHQKAVTIMRYVRGKLQDHLGTPSAAISALSPLAQFDAAVKGDGRLQCNNLIDIFVTFCAAYGVIARRINLWQGGIWGPDTVKKLGYNLLTAGGHTTAEIFDRDNNRWMQFDPMYDFETGYSLEELQRDFIEGNDIPSVVPFGIWRNYLGEQQRITYVCPRRLD